MKLVNATITGCGRSTGNYHAKYISAGVTGVLLVGTLYTALCAVTAEWRKARTTYSRKRNRIRNTMGILMVIAEVSLITHLFLSAFEIHYGFEDDFACEGMKKSKFVVYAVSVTAVFLVLWMRQRVFYASKALKSITTRLLRQVSVSIIIVMILGVVVGVLLILTTRQYASSAGGCVVHRHTGWIHLPEALMISCTGYFQITLFILFAYPIERHRRDMKNSKIDSSKLLLLIRRARSTTLIAVLVDAATAAISYSLWCKLDAILIQGLYELLVFTYILCVTFSFPDWEFRLYPFGKSREDEVDGGENDEFL